MSQSTTKADYDHLIALKRMELADLKRARTLAIEDPTQMYVSREEDREGVVRIYTAFKDVLSKREAEVLFYVCEGLRSETIAIKMFVTHKTIKFHLTNVYRNIGVESRAAAIVKVHRKLGVLPAAESDEDDALPVGVASV